MLVTRQPSLQAVYVVNYLLNSALFPADEFSASDAGLCDPATVAAVAKQSTPSPLDATSWLSRNKPSAPPPITYLEIYDCEDFSVSGKDLQPACLFGDKQSLVYVQRLLQRFNHSDHLMCPSTCFGFFATAACHARWFVYNQHHEQTCEHMNGEDENETG